MRASCTTVDALHALTLGDLLREHRRSYPGRTALVCGGRRFAYPETDERVNRLAAALRDSGVGPGDRVLWLGQNCHRVLEGLLAAAKVGAVFCPANWRQSAAELAFVLDDAEPAVVVWQQEEIGDVVREARSSASGGRDARWLQHDAEGEGSYEAFVASGAPDDPEVEVDPDGPVLQLYTAAFTGIPNGALLSHTAVVGQSLVMGMLQDIGGDYVYLNSGPLFHVATLMTTMATFLFAGTNVFTPRVDAEELCRLVESERCTGAFVVGPTVGQMVEANRDRRYDLSSLRAFPGPREWNEMVTLDTSPWARKPAGYGQTEVMGMLTFNAWGGEQQGTSGRPSPLAQVRIVDPEGREVAPGEVGEIVARGPTVMVGYHNRPEANAERRAGGWHHTNDLGRREADGSITFIGPKGRLIKSAAENIYPAEVEGCLARHPAVAEAAVFGVPDRTWTQGVKAVVVLKDGATASADELIEHCRASIASYKKPRSVEFVDRLPRNGWLVDYDALDERFGGGGYPSGSGRSA
jgi:acyl-CoA synthetase (AMP-forming)/AMP-acid ligase II